MAIVESKFFEPIGITQKSNFFKLHKFLMLLPCLMIFKTFVRFCDGSHLTIIEYFVTEMTQKANFNIPNFCFLLFWNFKVENCKFYLTAFHVASRSPQN